MLNARFDPLHPKRHEFYHSSGYAEVSPTAGSLGATSSETFAQRRAVDGNRQHVDRYAGVKHIADQRKHRPSFRDRRPSSAQPIVPARPAETPVIPPRTFNEPTARGYNPYS